MNRKYPPDNATSYDPNFEREAGKPSKLARLIMVTYLKLTDIWLAAWCLRLQMNLF